MGIWANTGAEQQAMRRHGRWSHACLAVCCALLAACGGSVVSQPGATGVALPADAVAHSNIRLAGSAQRDIDVRLFYPAAGCRKCPAIVFSHGAFASYDLYDVLLRAWAANGYIVAAPMHVDSERHPLRANFERDAVLSTRLEDLAVIRDFLAQPAALAPLPLTVGSAVIAAGHSYGALIAQAAGGARIPTAAAAAERLHRQPAPAAVIALSPPTSMAGWMDPEDWSSIAVPMLVVTGTTDVLPGFIPEWEMHLTSYEAAPSALSYALVFEDMNHYFNGAFGRLNADTAATAAPAIAALNERVVNFMAAAMQRRLPSPQAWRARSDALVSAYHREADAP